MGVLLLGTTKKEKKTLRNKKNKDSQIYEEDDGQAIVRTKLN